MEERPRQRKAPLRGPEGVSERGPEDRSAAVEPALPARGDEASLGGAAMGTVVGQVAGAVVAGPAGAVAGGVIGATVGGIAGDEAGKPSRKRPRPRRGPRAKSLPGEESRTPPPSPTPARRGAATTVEDADARPEIEPDRG